MRRFKTESSSFLFLPLLAVLTLASVSLTSAQTPNSSPEVKPSPASAPQRTSSPEAGALQTRRAAPTSPSETGDNPTLSASSDAVLVSEQSEVPKTEAGMLRDEISVATDEQERVRLQFKLVDHLVLAGQKQDAIAELKSMSEEERFDPQGFYNIGNALVRLGESEGAAKSYRKAIAQRNGRYSRAANNLGVVLLLSGQRDEAYEAFMSALRQESFRYAEASFNLGRLYAARGQNDLAVREWRRALVVDPEHKAAARAIANTVPGSNIVVAPRNSPEPLPNATARAAASPEVTRTTSSVAPGSSIRAGTTKPTGAGVRRPAYIVDPETYGQLQRGRTAREHGRNEEAVEIYRQVLARLGGYFAPANLELSYSLISLKRLDEAVAALLPITQREGSQIPISNYHLGRIYEIRGELKLAEDHYTRAADAYGGTNNQFILDVGRVREKQGNLAGALTSLEQYIAGMERRGQKPGWSEERLNAMRQKLAASQPKP